ncbi:MAG: condensation domain-containing protein [Candidatus Hodarchaeota archaeon]
MSETIELNKYKRKVSSLERIFNRSPYAIVTMVARIKGNVSENLLKDAVAKVQQRHLNLKVRLYEDTDHNLWFTSEGVKEIPIEIVSRESDEDWIEMYHEASKIPFDFEERPAIRFILVQSPEISELIILCHHIICDGLSLAYLARDIMTHLGDPTRKVEVLSKPTPMDKDNFPQDISINPVVKFIINNRINKKWKKDEIYFDQEDYKSLTEAYWNKYKHQMLSIELSEEQTSALVDRCRKEGVTVNTALTAAFVGAQTIIQEGKVNPRIAIGASLRDRLLRPAGEAMGFFAGGPSLNYKYKIKKNFWENARKLHRKVKPLYTNKNVFKELIPWAYLEPGIMESLCYKILGELVPKDSPRYTKLSAFSQQNDVVSSLIKQEKMESLDKPFLGTAVTNLTRLDFPRKYGTLELDRLIMNPGGMFPLAQVELVLGAVTCAGKLSLLVEYVEETIDSRTMEKIKEKALEFLLSE